MSDILKRLKAQCVNIVEPDGSLRLSLYNSENMAPAMMDGVNLLPGHREGHGTSGIMFYNTEGDECGGMGFTSTKLEDGGYVSSLSMTFDKYKNDQVVQVSLSEQNGVRRYGYTIYDRPDKHLSESVKLRGILESEEVPQAEKDRLTKEFLLENAVRMTLGRGTDGSVSARINDSKGRERIKIELGPDGTPCIAVLDQHGNICADIIAQEEGSDFDA